jgi:hypothetical protein
MNWYQQIFICTMRHVEGRLSLLEGAIKLSQISWNQHSLLELMAQHVAKMNSHLVVVCYAELKKMFELKGGEYIWETRSKTTFSETIEKKLIDPVLKEPNTFEGIFLSPRCMSHAAKGSY